MTDNEIQNLIAKWERLEKLASDHQRAARECKILSKAWMKDCKEAAVLYGHLSLIHSNNELVKTAQASMLRGKLEALLVKTIPAGAEWIQTYLSLVEDGTCLTYDQYLGILEEQRREAQEESKPMDISENSSPF